MAKFIQVQVAAFDMKVGERPHGSDMMARSYHLIGLKDDGTIWRFFANEEGTWEQIPERAAPPPRSKPKLVKR